MWFHLLNFLSISRPNLNLNIDKKMKLSCVSRKHSHIRLSLLIDKHSRACCGKCFNLIIAGVVVSRASFCSNQSITYFDKALRVDSQ